MMFEFIAVTCDKFTFNPHKVLLNVSVGDAPGPDSVSDAPGTKIKQN